MPVLIVGDIVTDIVAVYSGHLAIGSDTPATIRLLGGGSAANTAAWLAGRGRAVDLVAMVGDDAAGRERVAELARAGVGCRFVGRTAQAPTGSIIVLAHPGERSFLPDRGANLLLRQSHVDAALAAAGEAGHLHLSGYTLLDDASRPTGRHALVAARAAGWTISVDAASAEPLRRAEDFLDWIRGVDILFANLDEARALADPAGAQTQAGSNEAQTQPGNAEAKNQAQAGSAEAKNQAQPGSAEAHGQAQAGSAEARAPAQAGRRQAQDQALAGSAEAQNQARAGRRQAEDLAERLRGAARHVVIKLGRQGALWAGPDGVRSHPGRAATVVDPTGAGDAFAAGFLDAWLSGRPPLEPAVTLGAAAVSVLGGRPPRS